MNSKQIAVVGAGIAGLTAAYELQKKGHDITVFEASNRVGGRMSSDHIDGFTIDRGAQFLSSNYSTLIPLIKEVGLGEDLVYASPYASIKRKNKVCQFTPNNPLSLITSKYLSPLESIKLLFNSLKWSRKILPLSLSDYSQWSSFDDENCADFIKKEFGDYVLEYVIEPMLQGYYYQSPEETSKALGLMLLSFGLKKGPVLSLKDGMGSLPQKLAQFFKVQLNSPVTNVSRTSDDKVKVVVNGNELFFDNVILACPAVIAKNIYNPENDIEAQLLQTEYSSTVKIGAFLNNKITNNQFNKSYGILLPRLERHCVSGIGIETNKCFKRAPDGHELLDIMVDGYHGEQLIRKGNEEIIEIVSQDIRKLIPDFNKFLINHHIVKWAHAEPKSPVGRSKLVKAYKENTKIGARIVLAGDYLGLPYTDSAAYTGLWAANFINRSL